MFESINTDPKGILVYIEYYHGNVHPVSYELIGKACELAGDLNWPVYGVVIGRNVMQVKGQLLGCPLKEVYLYEAEDSFLADLYEELLSDCIRRLNPSVVLIGGTIEGRNLAPRTAVNFRTGLTADCTELSLDDEGNLIQVRPAFGGDIMARIITPRTRPQFATVRYGIMKKTELDYGFNTEFITVDRENNVGSRIDILNRRKIVKKAGIDAQSVLVVGGKGVKKKEDLDLLRELAVLLNGEIAGSRGLVEKGFLSHEQQIGLSGQTVAPNLLIACGVSGSVQFLSGMRNSKNIVAINTDEGARIMSIAHMPVLGDFYEIIPHMIAFLKAKG